MVTVANVSMWGMRVGAVAWNEDTGIASFQYAPEFIEKGIEPSPLRMPVRTSENTIYEFPALPKETFLGLPGMLADSLPDKFGNILLDEWLNKAGRTKADMNPVERLCYCGTRGMGALEYAPAIHEVKGTDEVDVNSMVQLLQQILDGKNNLVTSIHDTDMMNEILTIGTSAGGARAKAVVAVNDKTGSIISGHGVLPDGYRHWLLKFDGTDEKNIGFGLIEYSYYQMAKEAGIIMSECRLLNTGKYRHFMTRRFDRTDTGEKLHMQSLCGLAHYDFNNPARWSYEDAFQVMRNLRLPYPDAEQYFRRMVFNVYAWNRDDHTKNTAFIMGPDKKWHLSPAYDVTFAYDPGNVWLRNHQMSVNGKRDNISDYDLLAVSKAMNIKHPDEILEQIKTAVNSWEKIANENGVNRTVTEYINTILQSHL